jgi:hypothetical protein
MDIRTPEISRWLAKLIQRVPGKNRARFIRLAEAAKDMDSFEKNDYPCLLKVSRDEPRTES